MRKGFINGLLAGGLVGAALTMLAIPQMKPSPTKRWIGKAKRLQGRAERVVREVRDGVNDLLD